jgi:hypothetical protein
MHLKHPFSSIRTVAERQRGALGLRHFKDINQQTDARIKSHRADDLYQQRLSEVFEAVFVGGNLKIFGLKRLKDGISQASAICAAVAPLAAANCSTASTTTWLAPIASGVKRGDPARKSFAPKLGPPPTGS